MIIIIITSLNFLHKSTPSFGHPSWEEGKGNLFFFGGGEKGEGKSSFAVLGFAEGGADCKCAFSFAVDFFTSLIFNYGRI